MTEVKEVVALNDSVQTILDRSNDIQSKCRDFTVAGAHSKNIRFNENCGLTFIPNDNSGIHSLAMTKHSLSQLCAKMGVPVRYLEKCINEGRLELAQDNLNSWLSDYKKDLFIREYDGNARGILSSKYAVCDTPDILNVLMDVLDMDKYDLKGSFLNEERLHLRLISKEKLPVLNEDLFAGLFIDSSDVGRSTLTVKFCIYKQVCTNGLVDPKKYGDVFEQKHIGITAEEFHTGLSSSISKLDGYTENAIQMVNNAIELPSGFANSDNEEEITQLVKSDTNLSNEGASQVVALMFTKYGYNLWGYLNSITEVAQNYTLETRIGLETLAGKKLAQAFA